MRIKLQKRLQTKKFYKFLVKSSSFIIDLLGCKYIWYKLYPHKISKGNEPRTITLWLISIIVALFTIASSRYELELTRLEYRVSNLIMQAENSENVLSFIPALQKRTIPHRPSIFNPCSVIQSLLPWFDTYDDDLQEELQNIIVKKKHKLANLNLSSLVLVDKNLSRTNFQASNLNDATLYRNDLAQANFKYTKLQNTNFAKSYLVEANFSYSDLAHTDFSKANLRNANL